MMFLQEATNTISNTAVPVGVVLLILKAGYEMQQKAREGARYSNGHNRRMTEEKVREIVRAENETVTERLNRLDDRMHDDLETIRDRMHEMGNIIQTALSDSKALQTALVERTRAKGAGL